MGLEKAKTICIVLTVKGASRAPGEMSRQPEASRQLLFLPEEWWPCLRSGTWSEGDRPALTPRMGNGESKESLETSYHFKQQLELSEDPQTPGFHQLESLKKQENAGRTNARRLPFWSAK